MLNTPQGLEQAIKIVFFILSDFLINIWMCFHQDTECRVTVQSSTKTQYEQQCTTSYENVCTGHGYSKKCSNVPKQNCHQVWKDKIKPTLVEIYNFRFQSRLQFLTQSDNVDRCQRSDVTRFQFRYWFMFLTLLLYGGGVYHPPYRKMAITP